MNYCAQFFLVVGTQKRCTGIKAVWEQDIANTDHNFYIFPSLVAIGLRGLRRIGIRGAKCMGVGLSLRQMDIGCVLPMPHVVRQGYSTPYAVRCVSLGWTIYSIKRRLTASVRVQLRMNAFRTIG